MLFLADFGFAKQLDVEEGRTVLKASTTCTPAYCGTLSLVHYNAILIVIVIVM
jgi:hypothetical protein